MGLDLVMKEGCEWMGNKLVTLSQPVDGDRMNELKISIWTR